MADDLKKVQAGDDLEITAATWNKFIDAAQYAEKRQLDQRGGADQSDQGNNVIMVKNNTQIDCPRYGILAIQSILISPSDNLLSFQNRAAVNGMVPTLATAGKFVITREPIRAQEIGPAYISGLTPVIVNMVDADHLFADVSDDDNTQLESGAAGAAYILWAESGTGSKWALVRFETREAIIQPTNPAEIEPTPEGTETAGTDTWVRNEQDAAEDGVKLKVHTRTVYDDVGDEILYGFYREFTFDRFGRLAALSDETRYIIDTPGACS